jgi:anti-sigma factor ChrR (cupin superfamily)
MASLAYAGLVGAGWRDLVYEYFRPGLDVHWLARGEGEEPSVAILRYEPGARVPLHRHVGLETIVVLEGTQTDEDGDYGAGSVILNASGTQHSVWSTTGCVVLIQWDKPVVILDEEA